MNDEQKNELSVMLDELVAAQNTISHLVMTDSFNAVEKATRKRELLNSKIINFVDSFTIAELDTTAPRAGLRTCEVGPLGNPVQRWFHGWCGTSERPKAIIEGPHGNIVLWEHDKIRFTDIPGEEDK